VTNDSLKNVIESPYGKQLLQAWEKFKSDLNQYRPQIGNRPPDEFKKHALKKFSPKYALEVLLSPEPTFFGLKEVVFAGLCTWIVCPKAPTLIRQNMLVTALWQLQESEQVARENLTDPLFADMFARLAIIDRQFFDEVYYPIVELTPVDRLVAIGNLFERAKEESMNIDFAINILKIFHYYSCSLREKPGFLKPSLNRAYALVGEMGNVLGSKSRSERRVIETYQNFRRSAPLAYAASTIKLSEHKSMLDLMISQKSTLEEHGHLLNELVGRAAYIKDFLRYCADLEDYEVANAYLADVEPLAMPEPELSGSVKDKIAEKFQRKWRRSSAATQ
jgi:hypothetical protein